MTVYKSGGDLFNLNDLKTICEMEERIIRSTPEYAYQCPCWTSQGCGPSLSLGTYIASIRNRSSCITITSADVDFAKNLLQTCAPMYFSKKLSGPGSPQECREKKKFISDVFDLLVDIDFLRPSDILESTVVLSPRYYDTNFAREVYDRHLKGDRPEQNGIVLFVLDCIALRRSVFVVYS